MKIIQRAKKDSYRFIALKTFLWEGREIKIGEEIEIKDSIDQTAMVQRGTVRPSDLMDGLIYIALKPFFLPGQVEKFETKAMALICLKASDALALMLQRACLPRDPDQWRPFGMKLAQPKPKEQIFFKQLVEGEQDKLFKDSISFLPSQKKRK